MKEIKIGNGFDVHKLSVGKQIKLCGIEINHNKKLIGHSDADVGLHSLTDALLGALGKGDIKVVASTTWEEFRKFFDKDRAMMRIFQMVQII